MFTILYAIIFLIITLICVIPLVLIYLICAPFDREQRWLHYASGWWSLFLFRLNPFWRITVEGKEKIDRSQNYLIAVNHQSMFDIPLMYTLPGTFKWISKREVLKWPVFGLMLLLHGDILVKRGSSSSSRKMVDRAAEILTKWSCSVIMFPEGTRSKSGRVERAKQGAATIAKRAGVPILPVVLDGTRDAFKGWQLRNPNSYKVRVLDAIPAEQVEALDLKELTTLIEESLRAGHQELAPQRYK